MISGIARLPTHNHEEQEGAVRENKQEVKKKKKRERTRCWHRAPPPMARAWEAQHVRPSPAGSQPSACEEEEERKRGRKRSSSLEALPVEIAHCIFSELDLSNLGLLRRCNSRCRDLVDTLPASRLPPAPHPCLSYPPSHTGPNVQCGHDFFYPSDVR